MPELGLQFIWSLQAYMGIVHRLSIVGDILFSRLDELGEGRCILQGKWCPPGRDQLSISDGYALHPEWSWWTWVLLLGWSYWQVNILVVIYKSNTTIFSDVEGEWRWQGSGELVPDEIWNSGRLRRHIIQMKKNDWQGFQGLETQTPTACTLTFDHFLLLKTWCVTMRMLTILSVKCLYKTRLGRIKSNSWPVCFKSKSA